MSRITEEEPADLPVTLDDLPPPPKGGVPLGIALGATISVLVVLVLGTLTNIQLNRDERSERLGRERLLEELATPIAEEIEQAHRLSEIDDILETEMLTELTHGHSDLKAIVSDARGRRIGVHSNDAAEQPPPDSLQAQVPLRSELFPSGAGQLVVWQDDADFVAEIQARHRTAWIDIAITVAVIIIVVQLAIFFLVAKPLKKLLAAFEKVEQGYPVDAHRGGIVHELRWLEWRFHRMSVNLANNARLLVAAHRRAIDVKRRLPKSAGIDCAVLDPLTYDQDGRKTEHNVMRRYLQVRCATLEQASTSDPTSQQMAWEVWKKDVIEAERLGEMNLRARLENAALMILDRETFDAVNQEVESLVISCGDWCERIESTIESALKREDLSSAAIQRRIKHTAGVWRKMQEKNLRIEEVHDVFAFRIIVADLDACYLALNAVHRVFEPEPFRFKDYIAAPKANGYQSIHTSVYDRSGPVFEIQIRSLEMHRRAEGGTAAHWRYRADQMTRLLPRKRGLFRRKTRV